MAKDVELITHPLFPELGIEVLRYQGKDGKIRESYRFCRQNPNGKFPFTDLTEFQLNMLHELWIVHRYKARKAMARTGGGSHAVPRRRKSEPEHVSNAVSNIVNTFSQDGPGGIEDRPAPVSFENDDIPF